MRVLFCGDRDWTDRALIEKEMRLLDEAHPDELLIIEGGANGADTIAAAVAKGLDIPVMEFPADWSRYGRAAGPVRNRQMLVEGRPDLVYAFHDFMPISKGTKNMVAQARKAGIEVRLFSHFSPQ